MMTSIRFFPLLTAAILLLICNIECAEALSLKNQPRRQRQTNNAIDRRQALSKTVAAAAAVFGGLGTVTMQAQPAMAANAGPTPEELQRIQIGYKQITELLDNFEEATTTCRENGGECKRDAEPIRRVLGLRSTTDPLFQIEKVFNKVKYMDGDIDLETFFEASEDWNSAMTISNSMAFISQFGEYNPGGGKDEVLKYLNESKKAVIQAQGSLKKIMDALGLKEL